MRCNVAGCYRPASGYSRHCNTHKSRARRHGAADQEAVTKATLKPFLKQVTLRRERTAEAPAWAKMDGQWATLAGRCQGALKVFATRAHHRPTRIACQEVVKLARTVESREVVDTVLAMFLMQDQQPHRFRSDRAFIAQLVRRVRGLTDVNCGVWTNPSTGRPKRAYLDLPPSVVELMGRLLVENLGPAGVYIAKLERQDEEEQRKRSLDLAQALEELR